MQSIKNFLVTPSAIRDGLVVGLVSAYLIRKSAYPAGLLLGGYVYWRWEELDWRPLLLPTAPASPGSVPFFTPSTLMASLAFPLGSLAALDWSLFNRLGLRGESSETRRGRALLGGLLAATAAFGVGRAIFGWR